MYRHTQARINIENLRHNLRLLQKWNGQAFFCPMIKANAYGHGDILVARALEQEGVQHLGVALVEEGLALREAGIKAQILVFAPLDSASASAAANACLTPVVGRLADLLALQAIKVQTSIHLKFNTGMQRLGFDASDLDDLKRALAANPLLQVVGCCTHFTHGDDLQGGPSQRQLDLFQALTKDFAGVRHVHKTASLVAHAEQNGDLGSRPGIGLYGLPHSASHTGPKLRPVLSWHSQIEYMHVIEPGQSVSYSSTWTATRRSLIGVVPVGYADGYSRVFSNRAHMLCRGQRVPVVGNVCMDYTLVDLTDVSPTVQVGDPIVILGRQGSEEISADDLAQIAGTISYEIVTSISRRVPREAV